jgi:hypothetical protein
MKRKERYKDRAPDEFEVQEYPYQKRLEPIFGPIAGIDFWVILVGVVLALAFLYLSSV